MAMQHDTLFCVNFGENTTAAQLAEIFSAYGALVRADIPPATSTRSYQIAFVQFEREDDCRAALDEMNNRDVYGSPIRLSYARARNSDLRLPPPVSYNDSGYGSSPTARSSSYGGGGERAGYDNRRGGYGGGGGADWDRDCSNFGTARDFGGGSGNERGDSYGGAYGSYGGHSGGYGSGGGGERRREPRQDFDNNGYGASYSSNNREGTRNSRYDSYGGGGGGGSDWIRSNNRYGSSRDNDSYGGHRTSYPDNHAGGGGYGGGRDYSRKDDYQARPAPVRRSASPPVRGRRRSASPPRGGRPDSTADNETPPPPAPPAAGAEDW